LKQTSIDINKSRNKISPESGFLRIKADTNNKLYTIDSAGKTTFIANPYELPVISYSYTDPSILTPSLHDRYLVPAGAINDWAGHDQEIAIYNGTSWDFQIASKNDLLFNEDSNSLYYYDGMIWKIVSASPDEITLTSDTNNKLTIYGIDYIIDDTGLSIDPSHTTMSNPHHELVTRAFVTNHGARVDELTIERVTPGRAIVGTTNIDIDLYRDSWYSGCNDTHLENAHFNTNGVIFVPPKSRYFMQMYTNPPQPRPATDTKPEIPAGTYRFYANKDMVPYGIRLESDNYWSPHTVYYGTSKEESGRWLHEFVVTAPFKLHKINTDTKEHPGCFFQLINKDAYPPTNLEDLSVTGIDKIISADGFSLDNFSMKSKDPKVELGTLDYINKTKNNPDDITIEGISSTNIEYSTLNDQNLIFEDAFKHGILKTNWQLWAGDATNPNPSTVVNGIIYTGYQPSATAPTPYWNNNIIYCYDGPGLEIDSTHHVYVITNINWQLDTDNRVMLNTADGYQLDYVEQTDLGTGEYLLRFFIPKGMEKRIVGLAMYIYHNNPIAPTVSPYFKLVKYEEYPPNQIIKIKEIDHIIDDDNESIDGSDTPMSDAHRELITRAKHDNDITAITTTEVVESFTITALNITNGYIDLVNIPETHSQLVFLNGHFQPVATGFNPNDGFYTITTNRITFNDPSNDLGVGDDVSVKYKY